MSNGNNNGHNRNGVHQDTTIVARNGNGAHGDPAVIDGSDLLWDGLSPAVTQALSQPIDSALVSQRKGPGRAHLLLHRGPHRHLGGQQRSSASAGGASSWSRTSACAASRRSIRRRVR